MGVCVVVYMRVCRCCECVHRLLQLRVVVVYVRGYVRVCAFLYGIGYVCVYVWYVCTCVFGVWMLLLMCDRVNVLCVWTYMRG